MSLILEYLLNEEVSELIGAERYQRNASRTDYRNGSYPRRLATALGWVDVTVPRARSGAPPQGVLQRYQRREESVNALVREAYVGGCSTRDLEALTETLLGEGLSRSTISRGAVSGLQPGRLLEPGVAFGESAARHGLHLQCNSISPRALWRLKSERRQGVRWRPRICSWLSVVPG